MVKELKTGESWAKQFGIKMRDEDGWNPRSEYKQEDKDLGMGILLGFLFGAMLVALPIRFYYKCKV